MKHIMRTGELEESLTHENCFITEILNRDDYENFSIAQARVAPGDATENHTLRDTDEVYYIFSGSGEMEIGGEIAGIVQERDTVFIPRNTSQRIKNLENKDLIFLCICSPRFEMKNYI
jgi:mannose-6-phosphate isomerase-like protein (cupin superfamily)